MFNNVLIAEDYETSNISIQKTVEELAIQNIDHVYYCDDAFAKIQNALKNNKPYDLLITDLNFEEDHYVQQLKTGQDLIEVVKDLQPDIKVLVFSSNAKSGIIDKLFKDYQIDAYVRKARSDAKDLKRAISAISNNEKYLSMDMKQSVRKLNTYELSNYDITLVELISQGVMVKHIPLHLEKKNIKPSGISSVEKRISLLKEALDLRSNEQLVIFCKDLGLL